MIREFMTTERTKPHGNKYFVIQKNDGWAVKGEKQSNVSYQYHDKNKAITVATELAKENHAVLIVENENGGLEEKKVF